MYVVGSDHIAVRNGQAVPGGHHHAVDADGRTLCRANRPRFTWPSLTWRSHEADAACPLCVRVRDAQQTFAAASAYPVDPVAGDPVAGDPVAGDPVPAVPVQLAAPAGFPPVSEEPSWW